MLCILSSWKRVSWIQHERFAPTRNTPVFLQCMHLMVGCRSLIPCSCCKLHSEGGRGNAVSQHLALDPSIADWLLSSYIPGLASSINRECCQVIALQYSLLVGSQIQASLFQLDQKLLTVSVPVNFPPKTKCVFYIDNYSITHHVL